MIIAALVALNVAFSIVANAAFRPSALSTTWSDVLAWQVLGNVAGLVTVIALKCTLRYIPLGVAFPLTTAMSLLGVQVVAARVLFHSRSRRSSGRALS